MASWLEEKVAGLFGLIGDNKDSISTLGNLALGGYGLYQANEAANTAANFYDAAGTTTQERWNLIKPLEQAKADRELENLNLTAGMGAKEAEVQNQQLDLNSIIMDYQAALLPGQMDLNTELLRFQQQMLPEEEALYKSQNHVQRKALETATRDLDTYESTRGIEDEYFKQSLEGIDPNQESDKAQADVAHAFAGTMDAANRELARRGVAPGTGGYSGQVTGTAIQQAKAIGSARTTARNYAEDVNYNRLGAAENVRKGLAPATTGAITAPSAPVITPTSVAVPDAGNATVTNPVYTQLALGNAAANGAASTSNSSWDLIQRGLNG